MEGSLVVMSESSGAGPLWCKGIIETLYGYAGTTCG